MENTPIYTPVLRSTRQRFTIKNPEFEDGFQSGRNLKTKGIVRDPKTGKRYRIQGKSCGLPNCQCDAWADEIS